MAVDFAAGANYLQTAGNFDESAEASLCFWVNFSTLGINNRIVGTDTLYEGRLSTGDTLFHELRQGGTPFTSTFSFSVDTWYHIVLCMDGTVKAIYIDGLIDTGPSVNTHGTAGFDTPLSVGSATWNTGQGMDGLLEDVRFYDRLITSEEVFQIANSEGLDGITNGLIHWWTMNNGVVGQNVVNEPDLVGNQDLSTVVGSCVYAPTQRRFIRGLL